jgi:hypothetical protein
MITPEERLYLHWLGQSIWSGRGSIIEIGPWLGGSTICLAAGMRASGYDTHQRLQVFDNFIWREFMAARASLPLQPGDSFQSFFLENVKVYSEAIVSRVWALPDEIIEHDQEARSKRFVEIDHHIPIFEEFSDDPVEILFIDGAKSWRGLRHLLKILGPHLTPEKSYIVCQDFKYWGTYWVPIMMTRLEACLEPVHNVLTGDTVTFRVTSLLSSQIFERFEDNVLALPTDQTLRELDQASSLLMADGDELGAANVLLSKVSFLAHQSQVNAAVEEFKKIQDIWPVSFDLGHLERARTYLRTQKSCDIPRPKRLKAFFPTQRVKQQIKRQILRKVDGIKISRHVSILAGKVGVNPQSAYRETVRLFLADSDKAISIISQYHPFLILSTGRTGTRWLANLLNQIPGACIMHEPMPYERYAHAQAFMYPETAKKYLTEFRLLEIALRCRSQNPVIYGEVNGNLRRHAAAFKELIPDIQIIHLVRAGHEVVRSMMSRTTFTAKDDRNLIPPAVAIAPQIWAEMSRFEKICWLWSYENSYLRHHADVSVKFEDIISDYSLFKAQILTPLGLSLDQPVWQKAVQHPQNQTKEYALGSWEEWTPEQRQQFIRICSQEMAANGYKILEPIP